MGLYKWERMVGLPGGGSVKIAVSSTGTGLDAEVDPRFGRCQYFVIVDGDTLESEAVENPNVMASGGAGIQSAQLVADKGAEIVLTGNCGPNAFQTLQAAGISVCVGVAGTVGQVVEQYKSGGFAPVSGPSVGDKFGVSGGAGSAGGQAAPGGMGGGGAAGGAGRGMGGGRGGGMGGGSGMGRGMGMGGGKGMGRGMGMGGGRGMGGGMGRGGGRGMGRGMGMGVWPAPAGFSGMTGGGPAAQDPATEVEALKAQAEALSSHLEQIRQRIDELEKGEGKR
jgi:predicted Fe-Mo cluster-binding NifX family protein